MAGTVQEVFEEHLGVVAALRDNYTRNEDTSAVASIAKIRDEIAELCTAREEDVMQMVKELSQSVEAAEAQAAYPKREGSHEQMVTSLNDSTQAATDEVKRLQSQLNSLQQDREQLKDSFRDLRSKGEQLDKLIMKVEPKIRHQLSLYAHVSKVTWQFDVSDRVVGAVSDPTGGDIRHFDFNPQTTAHFDIVNQLWDLMD